MERERQKEREGEDGRVEDTGEGNYYCPVKLSLLILKFTGQ